MTLTAMRPDSGRSNERETSLWSAHARGRSRSRSAGDTNHVGTPAIESQPLEPVPCW